MFAVGAFYRAVEPARWSTAYGYEGIDGRVKVPSVDPATMWRHQSATHEGVMNMNKDQLRGRVRQTKGRVKELAGKLLRDERLQATGKAQKSLGKFQARFGDITQWVRHSLTKGR